MTPMTSRHESAGDARTRWRSALAALPHSSRASRSETSGPAAVVEIRPGEVASGDDRGTKRAEEIRRDELEAAERARLTIGVGRAINGQHRVAAGVVRAQRGEVGERH